jgi:hypothetical protein
LGVLDEGARYAAGGSDGDWGVISQRVEDVTRTSQCRLRGDLGISLFGTGSLSGGTVTRVAA